jgi:hypothetical protein
MAAREYWSAGKWVRVTDDLGATKWVGINRAITLRDELAAMPEQQRAVAMQRMQLQPDDPRLEQVIRVENDISDLEVDITIEEGADIPALQAENFQTLIQLAGMQPGLIPADVLIAASGLRNKDQLLERMKAADEAKAQQQQAQAPLVQRHAEATVAGLEAKANADQALATERQHATVNTIANTHQMHNELMTPAAPPDAPSDPGTVMPPEVQAAHDIADLRVKQTAADHNEAKVLHTLSQAHAAMNPPPPPVAPRGK